MKLRWITNTPTPYRNHRHRLMAHALSLRGVNYAVYYMAWTEPDRHWTFGPDDLDHPYRVFAGAHPFVHGVHGHLNPGLLAALHQDPPDAVVIGGWSMPTLWATPLVTRRALRLLGVESHDASLRRRVGPAATMRAWMIRNADGFVFPGPASRALIEAVDPQSRHKLMLELPNVVDEHVWRDGVDLARRDRHALRAGLNVPADTQLWVCPARLETFKGLHRLLPLLRGARHIALVIAGDGSQREALALSIEQDRLPVRLLGQLPEAEIRDLYAAADVFVLPSLSDPNPLSAVEAAAAGLPLLLSTRCGNHSTLVTPGVTGWTFDPEDALDGARAIRQVLDTPRHQLATLGANARARFTAAFDSRACIDRFADAVVERLRAR